MKSRIKGSKRRTYGPLVWIEPPISKEFVNVREKTVRQIAVDMKKFYMKNIPTIVIDNGAGLIASDNDQADIVREALRIIRYNGGSGFFFKVISSDINMYCTISPMFDKGVGAPRISIGTFAYGDNMTVARVFFGYDNDLISLSNISGPVVIGMNQEDINGFINSEMNSSICPRSTNFLSDYYPTYGSDESFIKYLRAVIKTVRKCFDEKSAVWSYRPSHSPMEMYTIKELYKSNPKSNGIPVSSVVEWTFKGSISDNPGYDVIKNGRVVPSLHTDENPLVALTDRSFNSVIRYSKKNGYMFPDEYEGLKKNINMSTIVSGSRYGSSFIYPITVNGETINSQLVFALHENNGCLMLDIPCEGVYFILTVLFDDLGKFNLYNNIITIDLSATVLDYNQLPSSADEGDMMIPHEFKNVEDVLSLIYKICALFIMIYERPARTRIIRERRRRLPSDGPIHKGDDKDYVIRHIMKTASEAKEYIRQMTGEHPEREYTMKNWPRAGHERHLSSGKVTWVDGCECHRRLPLSDKKIHLNL